MAIKQCVNEIVMTKSLKTRLLARNDGDKGSGKFSLFGGIVGHFLPPNLTYPFFFQSLESQCTVSMYKPYRYTFTAKASCQDYYMYVTA